MKFLDNITKNETRFQRYIGIKFDQLNVLVQSITPLWQDSEHKRLTSKNRIRNIGGGNEYTLESMKEKIVVVLMYYKMHLTQEFLGDLAGLDQSNVSRLLKKMLPLIEAAADPELKNYLEQAKEGCNRIATFAELCEQYPDLKDTATDATEQACYRSKKYDVQKQYYSGKSKQHAIKVQLTVAAGGRILDVTATYAGSVHDKKIMDQEKTMEKFKVNIIMLLNLVAAGSMQAMGYTSQELSGGLMDVYSKQAAALNEGLQGLRQSGATQQSLDRLGTGLSQAANLQTLGEGLSEIGQAAKAAEGLAAAQAFQDRIKNLIESITVEDVQNAIAMSTPGAAPISGSNVFNNYETANLVFSAYSGKLGPDLQKLAREKLDLIEQGGQGVINFFNNLAYQQELNKLAQAREAIGTGLTEAAAYAQTPWGKYYGWKNYLGDKLSQGAGYLGSKWQQYGQPAMAGATASPYTQPFQNLGGALSSAIAKTATGISGGAASLATKYGVTQFLDNNWPSINQLYPGIEAQFKALPERERNLVLGATAVLIGSALAGKGLQKGYQYLTAQPVETLNQQLANLEKEQEAALMQANNLATMAQGMPEGTPQQFNEKQKTRRLSEELYQKANQTGATIENLLAQKRAQNVVQAAAQRQQTAATLKEIATKGKAAQQGWSRYIPSSVGSWFGRASAQAPAPTPAQVAAAQVVAPAVLPQQEIVSDEPETLDQQIARLTSLYNQKVTTFGNLQRDFDRRREDMPRATRQRLNDELKAIQAQIAELKKQQSGSGWFRGWF